MDYFEILCQYLDNYHYILWCDINKYIQKTLPTYSSSFFLASCVLGADIWNNYCADSMHSCFLDVKSAKDDGWGPNFLGGQVWGGTEIEGGLISWGERNDARLVNSSTGETVGTLLLGDSGSISVNDSIVGLHGVIVPEDDQTPKPVLKRVTISNETLWTFDSEDLDLFASVHFASDNLTIIVFDIHDQIIALDAITGREKWRAQGVTTGSVSSYGDVVVCTNHSSSVSAFNLSTGDILWKRDSIFSGPIFVGSDGVAKVLVWTEDTLGAAELLTGKQLWTIKDFSCKMYHNEIAVAINKVTNIAYVAHGTDSGVLDEFDVVHLDHGTKSGNTSTGNALLGPIIATNDVICIQTDHISVVQCSPAVSSNEEIVWTQQDFQSYGAPMFISSGYFLWISNYLTAIPIDHLIAT